MGRNGRKEKQSNSVILVYFLLLRVDHILIESFSMEFMKSITWLKYWIILGLLPVFKNNFILFGFSSFFLDEKITYIIFKTVCSLLEVVVSHFNKRLTLVKVSFSFKQGIVNCLTTQLSFLIGSLIMYYRNLMNTCVHWKISKMLNVHNGQWYMFNRTLYINPMTYCIPVYGCRHYLFPTNVYWTYDLCFTFFFQRLEGPWRPLQSLKKKFLVYILA